MPWTIHGQPYRDPDAEPFQEALMAAHKKHREPDFAEFASAFSAGWIAHRDLVAPREEQALAV
jgi:hypothetical protein